MSLKLSYPVTTPDCTVDIMAWRAPYEEVFPKLKEFGYEAVELLVRDPASVDKERLDNALAQNGLVLSMIGTTPMQREDHLFLMDMDENKRKEAAKRLCGLADLAAYFKVPFVVGKYRGTVSDEPGCSLENLALLLKEADCKAGEAGITLLVEPQNPANINNLNTVGETVEWIESAGLQNTKLLMDLYHMDVTEESITDSLRKYKEYCCRIHLSDTERKAPGQGKLNFALILRTLEEIGFDGYASAEIKQDPDSERAAEMTAKAIKDLEQV